MKLRYFLTAVAATLALAAGCQKDSLNVLSEVQVSSSYVAIPQTGGSTTITVTSTAAWSISEMPQWLTITPASGNAGETKVTFSAASTLDGRNCDLNLVCAGKTQIVKVIQGLSTIAPATCAEILAGPEGKTYRVTGICTKIANTQYGNWYINDGTGEVYVYGTVNASGAYDWAKFNIEVGDEVTVEGPKTLYGSTVELVDATFISVKKSLIKVGAVVYNGDNELKLLPADGGEALVILENKGQGVYANVPEEYADWISIKGVNGNEVTFSVKPNNGAARSATLSFQTSDGKARYTAETVIDQDGRAGTRELPFTVGEAIAFCNTLSGPTTVDFYVKGIVSKIVSEFGTKYGNATFWISEDGVYNDDLAKDFEAYQVFYFNNKSWTETDSQIAVGAEVMICGHLTKYTKDGKTTAETEGKKAYIYSINGATTDAFGIGTEIDPFNIEGAIAAAKALPKSNVYVSGKISKVVSQFTAQYGNGTFWMSEDGVYNGDTTKDFEAYRVLWKDNKKWVDGDPEVKAGDAVLLFGQLTDYKGTSETAEGKAYVKEYTPAS